MSPSLGRHSAAGKPRSEEANAVSKVDQTWLVHHNDAGSPTPFAFTMRLIAADVDASVGSVGGL